MILARSCDPRERPLATGSQSGSLQVKGGDAASSKAGSIGSQYGSLQVKGGDAASSREQGESIWVTAGEGSGRSIM